MASTNTARFTRKLTDQQKEAILAAHFRDGHRGAQIARMAEQGQLGEPFHVGRYVYEILERGREQWEARDDQALADGTVRELRTGHMANLRALRALASDADPAERARRMKAAAESLRAWKAAIHKPTGRPKLKAPAMPEQGEKPGPVDGTLGELLDLAGNAKGPHDGGPSGTAADAA